MIFDIPDPTVIKSYLANISLATAVPDGSPPQRGILLLGYDGTNVRRLKSTSDGKLVLWLE